METNKTTIKQALELFRISRTSLYNHMKKLDIKPIKAGGRVHLIDKQIDELKAVLQPICSTMNNESGQGGQGNLIDIFKKQIKELKKELEKEREENKKLIHDVGRWQGRASTLEEQNQKLLSFTPEKNESADILDVEIIKPKPAPEKKAEKIGIFRKIINFRF